MQTICTIAPPRDHEHPENLERVARYITSQLEGPNAHVTQQVYEAWDKSYRNVSVLFGDPAAPRLVLGAHYDTDARTRTPGADDNASGVAVLIELARRLHESPPTGAIAVELVAYTLEEDPGFASRNMGSMRHAAMLKDTGVQVIGMVSLEMLGFFTDEPGSQKFPLPAMAERYPDTGNFIAVVGRPEDQTMIAGVEAIMKRAAEDPAVYSLAAPAVVRGIALSDHSSYWRHGYTAVMISDTSFYRNPHYHTPNDTPETLDYRRMAGVLDQVEAVVRHLAR